MSNICRLCMSRKDVLIPLFDNDNRGQTLSLPDKIMNFVPVIKVHHSTFSACIVVSHVSEAYWMKELDVANA